MSEATLSLEARPMRDSPDLIALAQRDVAAFGALYRRYYERVFRYCRRRLFLREVAEDLTGDVFLKVVETFDGFRGDEEAFRVWLHRVATNCANEYLRKRRRRRALQDGLARERRLQTPGSAAEDQCVEDADALKHALLRLSPPQQTLIALRYFEDLRHSDISAIVGGSPATVRSQLSRALARLRRLLKGGSYVFQRDAGHER